MPERGGRHRLHVVRREPLGAAQRGAGARRAEERDPRARARPEADPRQLAARADEPRDVVEDGRRDRQCPRGTLIVLELGAVFGPLIAGAVIAAAAALAASLIAFGGKALDALGLTANEKMVGFVHIGKLTKPPEDRPRPPLAEIVTRFGA